MREGIYDAWGKPREDIYEQWQEQTDPKNIQPEIRPLFHRIAEHLREYPPHDLGQAKLEEIIESVEAPWGRRYERELREVFKRDIDNLEIEKSREFVDKIGELGLRPYKAPEPLDPIEKGDIKLVCWLAIAPSSEVKQAIRSNSIVL